MIILKTIRKKINNTTKVGDDKCSCNNNINNNDDVIMGKKQ